MDLRLFFSTFALVFLAELGDKTQLASMAASAGTKSPVSVFAGAASALVFSSLIAVLLGSTLQRIVPLHVLKIGAAVLFLAFGVVLLINALVTVPAKPEPAAAAPGKPSIVARLVFDSAAQFERSAINDYDELAKQTSNPHLKALWEHLAEEERMHLSHLHSLTSVHGEHAWEEREDAVATVEGPGVEPDVAGVIDSAISHEQATADFYRELSQTAPLPGVRTAFRRLAEEEDSHVAHLKHFRAAGTMGGHSV